VCGAHASRIHCVGSRAAAAGVPPRGHAARGGGGGWPARPEASHVQAGHAHRWAGGAVPCDSAAVLCDMARAADEGVVPGGIDCIDAARVSWDRREALFSWLG